MAGAFGNNRSGRLLPAQLPLPSCTFLGTAISPLSLEELEVQVYREQPWLQREWGDQQLPAKLLLAAAARAAKTEARRTQETFRKAERAAAAAETEAARADAAEEEQRAYNELGGIHETTLKGSEATTTATTATTTTTTTTTTTKTTTTTTTATTKTTTTTTAETAATKKKLAERCRELAVAKRKAALYYWDGETELTEDEDTPQITYKPKWGVRPPRQRQEVGSEDFACGEFSSSRSSRATYFGGRPEDFMDEEDKKHAARAARGRASAFQWEGGAPSAAAASVNSSGVASSWFRAEGADETLPFYLAHEREPLRANLPQWRMHSMRRHQWMRAMRRLRDTNKTSSSSSSNNARGMGALLQEGGRGAATRGPQLPPHVEEMRQLLRAQQQQQQQHLDQGSPDIASGSANSNRGSNSSASDSAGEASTRETQGPPREEETGGSVLSLLAAEATAAAAEDDDWGWAAAQRLLRLQPLGPAQAGLGFYEQQPHQDLQATASRPHPANPYTSSSSSSSSKSRRRYLCNYSLDDDDDGDCLYSSTAPTCGLYTISDKGGHLEASEETGKEQQGLEEVEVLEGETMHTRIPQEERESIIPEMYTEKRHPAVHETAAETDEALDEREWILQLDCDLPLLAVPADFSGVHVETEEDMKACWGECATASRDATGDKESDSEKETDVGKERTQDLDADTQESTSCMQTAEKNKRGRGFSSSSGGLLMGAACPTRAAAAADEAAVAADAYAGGRRQPLWGGVTSDSRRSLLQQIAGREVHWLQEGTEEAAVAAAQQPTWLQQHQQQLLRRNQQHRMQQQLQQMRHRLNSLLLPFVSDPETQKRFEMYMQLREQNQLELIFSCFVTIGH
ncbi:hypothetical protein, conserved [Eimeria maxima]|uniref:G patch domain-containing protein n=1 Tax=Eimeria maxima TaxID=5804 RepID=U6M498_EIMMA|nr:hypothetical protein, conserved [Eimeria maxima]CDJ58851.1 hypothetical protein, conserved [Eimeria maxima]